MDILLLVLVFAGAYVLFMFLTVGLAKLFFPRVDEKETVGKSKTLKAVRKSIVSR
jgi:hypothetical protein